MKTAIDKFQSLIGKLDEKSQGVFHSKVSTEEFPKNRVLVEAGQVCKYSFIVLEGCIRKFYLKDGIEITSEFVFPGEMAVSFGSFLKKQPSVESLQTLEKTKAMVIPFSVFEFMQREHPEVVKENFNVLVDYLEWLEKRLFLLQYHTAKERYQILLDTQPELVKKIPLMFIASYLGITLETLSRIRAQLII